MLASGIDGYLRPVLTGQWGKHVIKDHLARRHSARETKRLRRWPFGVNQSPVLTSAGDQPSLAMADGVYTHWPECKADETSWFLMSFPRSECPY